MIFKVSHHSKFSGAIDRLRRLLIKIEGSYKREEGSRHFSLPFFSSSSYLVQISESLICSIQSRPIRKRKEELIIRCYLLSSLPFHRNVQSIDPPLLFPFSDPLCSRPLQFLLVTLNQIQILQVSNSQDSKIIQNFQILRL